jgi:NMD protein affecting ribosome stability and mRNA decay
MPNANIGLTSFALEYMIYRCIKVQHKPIKIEDRVQIQRCKETECAHQDRTGLNWPLSGFFRRSPL